MKKKTFIQFTAVAEGNALSAVGTDDIIKAVCPVPDGASEDYGYMTMKAAVIAKYEAMGGNPDNLAFWYDGQESTLYPDAYAVCPVTVEVELAENTEV